MKKIETARLILRGFEQRDYDDLYEFLSQRREEQFEAYPGITYENGTEHLQYRLGSEEFYAMEQKETGKVIGNVYLGKRDFMAREVGYIVNKNYQRQGYASEAIQAVMEEAFSQGVHRIIAECDPRNTCSWMLLEKLHFTREAEFRQNVFFFKDEQGQPMWQDTYVYAILAD
ncbi:MAG: GNAT family protein [Lachnospiraceae bacterium]|nr:GNAT family protein [Lachnospiraceae bacterium]